MAPRLKIALVALLALLVCFAVVAASMGDKDKDEQEQQVTLEQLPAAVRATLESEAAGGTITEIVKETKDGAVVYEADVTKDGKKLEVKIAEDGKLIKSAIDDEDDSADKDDDCGKGEDKDEVKVTFDQLPAAVQATLKSEAGSGSIGDIEKETKHGKVVYEADITKDGNKVEVKIAEDGKLIKSEIEGKDGDSGEQDGIGDKDDEDEAGEQD
jgi:uncharacterized membrane protein YkoI